VRSDQVMATGIQRLFIKSGFLCGSHQVRELIYRKNFTVDQHSRECSHITRKLACGNKVIFGEFLVWFFGPFSHLKMGSKKWVFHRRNVAGSGAKKEMKLTHEYTHIVTAVTSPTKVTHSCT
jgi:hypothetical protein